MQDTDHIRMSFAAPTEVFCCTYRSPLIEQTLLKMSTQALATLAYQCYVWAVSREVRKAMNQTFVVVLVLQCRTFLSRRLLSEAHQTCTTLWYLCKHFGHSVIVYSTNLVDKLSDVQILNMNMYTQNATGYRVAQSMNCQVRGEL